MRILLLLLLVSPLYAQSSKYYVENLENTPENIIAVRDSFEDISLNKQNARFKVYTTTPTLEDLGKGNVVLMESGGSYRIYIRIEDDLIKFEGVKVN